MESGIELDYQTRERLAGLEREIVQMQRARAARCLPDEAPVPNTWQDAPAPRPSPARLGRRLARLWPKTSAPAVHDS